MDMKGGTDMGIDLEELVAQKRAIEKQIRMIRNREDRYGCAKIGTEHYPTGKPDRHYLAIKYRPLDGVYKDAGKWVSVFASNDRGAVVEQIPEIIEALQGLYKEVKGE